MSEGNVQLGEFWLMGGVCLLLRLELSSGKSCAGNLLPGQLGVVWGQRRVLGLQW